MQKSVAVEQNNFTKNIFLVGLALILSGCVFEPQGHKYSKQEAADARINLAINYLAENNLVAAKKNLDTAAIHKRDYYLTNLGYGFYYQQQGEMKTAEQFFIKANKQKNNDITNYYYAQFLCMNTKYEQAFQHFDRIKQDASMVMGKQNYQLVYDCAKLYGKQDKIKASLQKLQAFSIKK